MSVLIGGLGHRAERSLLADAVERRGHEVIDWNVGDWPGETPLTVTPGSETAVFGTEFSYEDVTGAYVVSSRLFRPYDKQFRDRLEENFLPVLNQMREYRGVFESVCRMLEHHGADVVPPLRDHYWHDRKPWQLHLFDAAGVPVPDTVFTNDPDEVRAFYETHDRVVYKPVTRGGVPHELTDDDLAADRLEKLATAPVQFQAYVPGDDLRVYVLDGEVVGAIRYESETFSFKVDMVEDTDSEVGIEAATLSDAIVDSVTRAVDESGLTFAAADVRRQSDGTHALLELNEVPRFAAADTDADQDVAAALAAFLTR